MYKNLNPIVQSTLDKLPEEFDQDDISVLATYLLDNARRDPARLQKLWELGRLWASRPLEGLPEILHQGEYLINMQEEGKRHLEYLEKGYTLPNGEEAVSHD